MEFILISAVAFLAAILTFFSGFGLGTILMPVFMLFFPVELAVAFTGIVHFLNGLFKFILVGRQADKEVVIRFGLPALLAAFAGAWLLVHMSDLSPLFTYHFAEREIDVYPIKFIISLLLLFFVVVDFIPYFNTLQFDKKHLPIGGLLSGFFGGLSGVQGALRSAFLVKAGLSKERFIATTVVIACLVDLTRLSLYASQMKVSDLNENMTLLTCATFSAISGAYLGNILLKKVSLKFVQAIVAVALIVLALGLGSGML